MDYFIDIKLLPDLEIDETALLSNLFSKLHRTLARYGDGNIGVSFPKANKFLGSTLRLHGTESKLSGLMAIAWLKGLGDYSKISTLQPIPNDVKHCTVTRIQAKSAFNKRKRSVAKGWLSEEEALAKIPDDQQKTLKLPYIQLNSLTSGQTMRVYVKQSQPVSSATAGKFSRYGLSRITTVPWF